MHKLSFIVLLMVLVASVPCVARAQEAVEPIHGIHITEKALPPAVDHPRKEKAEVVRGKKHAGKAHTKTKKKVGKTSKVHTKAKASSKGKIKSGKRPRAKSKAKH